MRTADVEQLDHSALRTNQAVIIVILAIAFIVKLPQLVFICALLMLLGGLFDKPAFLPIYRLLGAAGLIRPDPQPDHKEPHRFAQLLGAIVLLGGSVGFFLNITSLGWISTMVVIVLAGLNLFLGFCMGCTLYYWLARLGVPGFDKTPVEGTG
jgi:hypothetical protein